MNMTSIRQNKMKFLLFVEKQDLSQSTIFFHLSFSQSSVHPTKAHDIADSLSTFTSRTQFSSTKSNRKSKLIKLKIFFLKY